jgi:hypothetical protein
MLNFISMYLSQWFDNDSNLHEYGSELERYIMAHNPESTHDIERLTRDFERKNNSGTVL